MSFARFLTAVVLSAVSPAQAQVDAGTMTAATLLQYCRAPEPERLAACDMALFSIVVMHGIDREMGRAQNLFCVSLDAKPPEIRAAVVQQLGDLKTLLDQQYVGGVIVALAKAFPCRK